MYNVTCQYPNAKRVVTVFDKSGKAARNENGTLQTQEIPETFNLCIVADNGPEAVKIAKRMSHGAVCFIPAN